jgi:hypothetical protein
MINAGLIDSRRIIAKRVTQLSDIEEMARKLEPQVARAILDALQQQAESVDLRELEIALSTGQISHALSLLSIDKFDAVMAPAQSALRRGVFAAGASTVARALLPTLRGVAFRFNELNPRLIDWLQRYELNLIREINDKTREGVRTYLTTGMTEGKNPRAVAKEVKQIVGLTDRQAIAVKNFRRNLETFHLRRTAQAWGLGNKIDRAPGGAQVFKPDDDGTPKDAIDERRLRDFRYDKMLQRAMEQSKPLTPAQIDKMVDAYSRKYLKHRAETIARTEALRTTNVGVQDAWRQAIDQGKVATDSVRRKWIVAADERLCEFCAPIPSMNGKLGVRMDQPFQTPKGPQMLPPLHPNCRCTVFARAYEPKQIAAAEAKK